MTIPPPPAERRLRDLVIAIKGAGEMASAIAWRLHRGRFGRVYLMELAQPTAIRRRVAFSEAVYQGSQQVEDVTAVCVGDPASLDEVWRDGRIGLLIDPEWASIRVRRPDVLVDAILAKQNLGTRRDEAPFVIALGPGFTAGVDAHVVIGTNRGHNLGRVYTTGADEPHTGVPGKIGGYTVERVIRAPCDGVFSTALDIGTCVREGEAIGAVGGQPLRAGIAGIMRGLLRSGATVRSGAKIGDIDPRGMPVYCETISDKARAIAGSVLEASLWRFN